MIIIARLVEVYNNMYIKLVDAFGFAGRHLHDSRICVSFTLHRIILMFVLHEKLCKLKIAEISK